MNDAINQPPPPSKLDFARNRSRRGRPRKYESPDDFAAEAAAYFESCDLIREPYTITGLALFMGFFGREEYNNYLAYEGFEEIAKHAKGIVENGYEKRLLEGKPVGSIFALKNMGWRDEKQVDLKSSDGSMSPKGAIVTLDTSKLTTDQLAAFWGAMTVTVNET